MNRWIRSAAVLVVLATAACGDTSSGSPLAPEGPSLNSGLISTGNSTTTQPVTSDTTSAERSGLISSGN